MTRGGLHTLGGALDRRAGGGGGSRVPGLGHACPGEGPSGWSRRAAERAAATCGGGGGLGARESLDHALCRRSGRALGPCGARCARERALDVADARATHVRIAERGRGREGASDSALPRAGCGCVRVTSKQQGEAGAAGSRALCPACEGGVADGACARRPCGRCAGRGPVVGQCGAGCPSGGLVASKRTRRRRRRGRAGERRGTSRGDPGARRGRTRRGGARPAG